MRRIIGLVVAAAAAVAVAWWIAALPGTVSASIGGYAFESSTPVAAVAGAILLLALLVLLRVLLAVIGLPRGWRRWRARHRRASGDVAVTRALVALAAGDPGDARHEAARARRFLGDTPQTLLLAAEAGRLAGSEDEATAHYNRLVARDDAAFLGLRGLFRQAMAREDWAAAAALAARAEAAHPGAAWLRAERTLLAVRTANWSQAFALAGPDAPRISYATAAAEAAGDPAAALKLARRAWKENPAFTPAALAYARRLREAGREGRAQDVLRQGWTMTPHPDLADLALRPTTDPIARVQQASRLVGGNPEHQESHFLLARLSLAAGLSGEARRHADAAARAGLNERRLWMLRAELEGDAPAGREALRLAATAAPDAAWRCDACGAEQAAWAPVCPACHVPGRLRWGQPLRPALTAE